MFRKILIANRGEIACRIARTARRMGIRTVAVYSEPDRQALHVALADEAVCVGGAPSSDSYLNAKAILAAVESTGADAVHPGYGFLSENAAFARRLKRQGTTFIGPLPRAIKAMGDKLESKRLAARAGVSTVPGHDGAVADSREAVRIGRQIGYPVMLKASAGGGGKGMRVAHDDAETRQAFDAARREAAASFGDDRILIEKFIEQPRHIEIQVLADSHGNTVHLGERECSIQRRHQKVVEEAPSPFLDADTRSAMGEQAVALSRAVRYQSAGTVEFIVGADRQFYFLEMNTRLQVEHPVTEFVTGLDLVEQMIRIAAGERLSISQADVVLDGWAIETRIYAEDPLRGFLPSVGRLVRYSPPEETAGLRIDSGVHEGSEISVHYDPMIAKVITHGADRAAAIHRMSSALDSLVIDGVANNTGFLAAVMAHPRFREGRLSTGFIAEEYPDGFRPQHLDHDDPRLVAAIGAAIHHVHEARAARISGQVPGHERAVRAEWVVRRGADSYAANVIPVAGGWDILVDGDKFAIRAAWRPGQPLFDAVANGTAVTFRVDRDGIGYRLTRGGGVSRVRVFTPDSAALAERARERTPVDQSATVLSPMPGLLVSLDVEAGQEVKAGEALATIEAMKMENVLRAERDGIVETILAAPGDNLAVDQPILAFAQSKADGAP